MLDHMKFGEALIRENARETSPEEFYKSVGRETDLRDGFGILLLTSRMDRYAKLANDLIQVLPFPSADASFTVAQRLRERLILLLSQ